MAASNACSDWCGSVEDLQAWSSPAMSSTPPCFAVPAALACLNTSPLRSTPGPLPYHMAKTPSYLAPGKSPTCCEPHTAVAASSSFTPGREEDVMRLEVLCAPSTTPGRTRPAASRDSRK